MEKGIKTVEEVITKVAVRVVETLPMDITDRQSSEVQKDVEEYLKHILSQTEKGVSCSTLFGGTKDKRIDRTARGVISAIAVKYFILTPNGRALKKEIENLLDIECR